MQSFGSFGGLDLGTRRVSGLYGTFRSTGRRDNEEEDDDRDLVRALYSHTGTHTHVMCSVLIGASLLRYGCLLRPTISVTFSP